ncbi:Spermatogenesis-defective protein 39 [Caenorhabditis elegans]|uniref:Spermatogenesis-defective protein 39 n=1 Tax=Caenorhabditis elegans TaxID=6239 RepID=G8JYD7_CAEEL|nr:Spermatogenesis-defective protein 39 [Caenorhabditis elegans]CCD72491.1 Spermatogenesis-defective protein 39 [Caenorhabditis elegans]|eukprot:NP_504719.1 Spermatogenesis-defective protein 39 [Caenorhabditis elegans]
MALRRKFTFELPEDSYWNESDSNSSGLFDDLQSKQLEQPSTISSVAMRLRSRTSDRRTQRQLPQMFHCKLTEELLLCQTRRIFE